MKEIYRLRDRRIFKQTLFGTLKVMSHLSFHLYISTAPCGDGAVFTRADPHHTDGDHEPVFKKRQHGLLRTNVEKGEGTIPTDDTPRHWTESAADSACALCRVVTRSVAGTFWEYRGRFCLYSWWNRFIFLPSHLVCYSMTGTCHVQCVAV